MQTSEYALILAEHEVTGRVVATCSELPGFIAHGRDVAELRSRIPNIMRRVLEREGKMVESIELKPDAPDTPSNIRIRACDPIKAVATFDLAA